MGEPSVGVRPSERPAEERLDSWKEIAAYLNRDVTTAQRWEKREGMPVHRHLHARMGSVYAYRGELDAWARGRNLQAAGNGNNGPLSDAPELPSVLPPALPHSALPSRRSRWKLVLLVAVAGFALSICVGIWLQRTEYFWRSPVTDARFQMVTDFGGMEQDAAVSRDGHLVAFLSDRDGQTDVWVTQIGSGQFHNLTRGSAREIVNPSIRTLGFSPDGSLVTYWIRRQDGATGSDNISVWAVPTLGGEPKPYLEGVAEYDWSRDGARLTYHTPGAGDPLFVTDGERRPGARPVFTAPGGLHSHFPLWSPDATFVYFVQGSLPDKLDIWRIPSGGGVPERITRHNARVVYPVLLNRRTLMYLATDSDGSGPWLYSMDVERRIPHKLTTGPEPYTSLAASADGRRLVAAVAHSKTTLWRLQIPDSPTKPTTPTAIPLTTATGFSPRLGANYLLYVSATGKGDSIWKLANGTSSELWSGEGARIVGGPAVSPDGNSIAFSVSHHGRTLLYAMQTDGTNTRIVADSLNLQGAPAWAPDGQSITSAVMDGGVPHLFRIPIDGRSPTPLVREYSVGPTWTPDGGFAVYSGPDIGTVFTVKAFSVKAVTGEATPYPLRDLTLTRGARHLAFLPGGRTLVYMRGDLQHKDLWLIDLDTGAERQLTHLPSEFDIRDFDISPDGHELVLERVQERSDIVMLDIPQR
jgi:Tol biopolymer transport system component